MVLKGFNLARLSLTKAFTHGSAQSFVAASQSSYAAQNSPFGTLANTFSPWQPKSLTHAQLGFNQAFAQAANSHNQNGPQDSLATFLATWNKHQRLTDPDHQSRLPHKWTEWKRSGSNVDSSQKPVLDTTNMEIDEEAVIFEDDIVTPPPSTRSSISRSYSSGHIDELRRVGSESNTPLRRGSFSHSTYSIDHSNLQSRTHSSTEISDKYTDDSIACDVDTTVLPSTNRRPSPENDLLQLEGSDRLADVPAAFDNLVAKGHIPSTESYNALLRAVIILAESNAQAVSKGLYVHSDMIQRGVLPDVTTFALLINLLSSRALDVFSKRSALEALRERYATITSSHIPQFILPSHQSEYASLTHDDSLEMAIHIFDSCSSSAVLDGLPNSTYHRLISASANEKKIDDMIRIYSRMELLQVVPQPETFIVMINAFASIGDLRSAVDTYNEYKSMAVENDNGNLEINRQDHAVYVAIVRAYHTCDRPVGGNKFAETVLEGVATVNRPYVRDSIDFDAIFPLLLESNQLDVSLDRAREYSDISIKQKALSLVTTKAADTNNAHVAKDAFEAIPDKNAVFQPAVALCAMHLRAGDVPKAEYYWNRITSNTQMSASESVELSTMYSLTLVRSSQVELGLQMARKLFDTIRQSFVGTRLETGVAQSIDNAVEVIDKSIFDAGISLSLISSLELMRLLVGNDGLVPAVAVHALASIGSDCLPVLEASDLSLIAQVQAGLILSGAGGHDIGDSARLVAVVETFLSTNCRPDDRTMSLVGNALSKLDKQSLLTSWQSVCSRARNNTMSSLAVSPVISVDNSVDVYAQTMDNSASVAITAILENITLDPQTRLGEALRGYHELRQNGGHPRYYVYAKLITEAGNLNNFSTCRDILAAAYHDIPPQPQFKVVKHGWTAILDSMIVACLNTGNRHLANGYHTDLLNLGSSPTANTFGLYITTLKESGKTLDEASEALKIFRRSQVEGVEPTSFLYNALIGKLGKARRIDDCMFYFNEMRNKGVHPTSVTYGTIVNALCRVGDERHAEELFDEMEAAPNYKARSAPYHSMMQFFLTIRRDRNKVLGYYERMVANGIQATSHTHKLLMDTFATIEPVDMPSAEQVLGRMRTSGHRPEAVHYASLIHAKGCVLHDMAGASALFEKVISERLAPAQACLYQALFESMVANNVIERSEGVVADMEARRIEMSPYVANSLIQGWSLAGKMSKAKAIFRQVPLAKREPSTYESMTRAFILANDRPGAMAVVDEALSRGYPTAVVNKILDIVNQNPGFVHKTG